MVWLIWLVDLILFHYCTVNCTLGGSPPYKVCSNIHILVLCCLTQGGFIVWLRSNCLTCIFLQVAWDGKGITEGVKDRVCKKHRISLLHGKVRYVMQSFNLKHPWHLSQRFSRKLNTVTWGKDNGIHVMTTSSSEFTSPGRWRSAGI